MIAVDTNVLVFAHRKNTDRHVQALAWIKTLSEGKIPWALPVFCIGEFFRVVTHRSIFRIPSTIAEATGAIDAILESPSVRVLNPAGSYYRLLRSAILKGNVKGNLVYDAQIAALCRENGIRYILTDDRDFSRFRTLSIMSLDDDPGSY